MSSKIMDGGTGFHRLVFKVDGGKGGMTNVTVMISLDAHRKLSGQIARARIGNVETSALLKTWARWEVGLRYEETGMIPSTVTITARDVDDFGAYAMDLGRSLRVS